MSNPAPTLNQINAFNATQGTTIDFNIIGGTEVIRSNKIYIYDLSDNSLICTHLYVSTESIHELPANTDSSIVYESGKSSADFVNGAQYYAQIQTYTDTAGMEGGSGLSVAKMFWCLVDPTLTITTIPSTISTTSYNVSAIYDANTSVVSNIIQQYQFSLYSATGSLLQSSGVVVGNGEQQGTSTAYDISYNFSGLSVGSSYYVAVDVTTTQGMNVSTQSGTFTVSIDTPTLGEATVVNNACDGYISVTSNLSGEYGGSASGEIATFVTDSVNDVSSLKVTLTPQQDGTPWIGTDHDTTPYLFRAMPEQSNDYNRESGVIVGGTVAWNQLVKNGNFANTNNWSGQYCSISASDNVLTANATAENVAGRIEQEVTLIAGHKYLFKENIKVSANATSRFAYRYSGGIKYTASLNATANTWGELATVFSADTQGDSGMLYLYYSNSTALAVGGTAQYKNVMLIDLTAMFGSTIADYIYSLEQATAGAGVAWFRKLFPKDYYEYNAGELLSVEGLESHDTVGFNQWDEEWEVGSISRATGQNENVTGQMRSKNYIRVLPNTQYYLLCANNTSGASIAWICYDENKNFISSQWIRASLFTTPLDCHYIRFTSNTAYGNTYKNDICINISSPSRNGEYEEYVKHSYPLDNSLTLHGIPKLDASNNLYYDGDIYASDGTVTRKYGIVDLGTLSWTKTTVGNNDAFVCYNSGIASTPDVDTVVNAISPLFVTKNRHAFNTTLSENSICGNSAGHLVAFTTTTYESGSAFKSAMSGVMLTYELATPTTETADPFTNPQVVDPHGTEQYVGSPIPVGHETTYQRICPISGWDSVEVDVVGKNLLPVACDTTTKNGVTYTVYKNANGAVTRIHAQGTATSAHSFKVVEGVSAQTPFTLKAGSYWLGGLTDGASGVYDFNLREAGTTSDIVQVTNKKSFVLTEDTQFSNCYLYIYNGKSINTDIYPMIWLQSDSSDNFEPYQGTTYTSTFPKYKQQVSQDKIPYITKNIGDTYADTLTENLVGGTIAWNQLVRPNKPTFTYNGVTITNNGDGTFTFSGTANATGSDAICYTILFQQSHKYILLCKGASNDLRFYDGYGADGYDIGNGKIVYWNRASANGYVYFNVTSGITYNVKVTPMLIDLTQMFGTTIADYIYSLEQAITGAGVAWFKQLFPNDYYEYNSGQLISVNASAHVIKDANGNVLHTYPLDSDLVLRGIPKLDANNKLYYDGDVYEPDGSVTRKYGIVDLGTLNWTKIGSGSVFWASPSNRPTNRHWNGIVSKYVEMNSSYANLDNMCWTSGSSAREIYVRDDAYADATTFKTAMSGVYLVYELATPTTEQADPFEENQAIIPNGIEEYTVTEQGDVEMPVGHDSTYYATEVYGGTIDMASGVLTITHKVQVLDGTESWNEQSVSSGVMPYLTMSSYGMKQNQIGYCDKFLNAPSTNPVDGHGLKFGSSNYNVLYVVGILSDLGLSTLAEWKEWLAINNTQIVYELATPITIQLTPQQMQTLSGQNNIWSNTNGGMYLVYQLPITSLLVKRRDVADISGKWLTLYSTPITQASDMDFTFIDFLNQYGKTYQYALVPLLTQTQSGVVVQIEGGYTVSDNVDSIFDGVYIADQTNVERVKAGVGYGNIDMNQGVGSIIPIGSKYPIVITNSQNQYHNGSIRGTIVPNNFYSNGNLSRIDMVNKRDELEQFLTNKRAKIIKDWNGNIWLVMIMSNVNCSFDDNYGMGMVSFSADWLEVGDPTNQQDLYNAGLINVGGV